MLQRSNNLNYKIMILLLITAIPVALISTLLRYNNLNK